MSHKQLKRVVNMEHTFEQKQREYEQKVFEYLESLEEGKMVAISELTNNPELFIDALKKYVAFMPNGASVVVNQDYTIILKAWAKGFPSW